MLVSFLYALRARKIPVGTQELLALAKALEGGLHDHSLDGFYYVARALLVHNEAQLDDFDDAFLWYFKGIERESKKLKDELLDWLKDPKRNIAELSDEQKAWVESLDLEALERLFYERLHEQKERHDGGSHWIGTGGTSPFGHGGNAPQGIRVGGEGGGRRAVKVASERNFRGYRNDLTLDLRQMQVALRKLKLFTRVGARQELDLEGTIKETAHNAGDLTVLTQAERRSNTRIILLMDVGGSMDPYVQRCSQLFSAAQKSTHFKELRSYYFHNCIYGHLYTSEALREKVLLRQIFSECGPHYKVIVVGDAAMAPYELWHTGGGLALGEDQRLSGLEWLMLLQKHFRHTVWLNPEPERYWYSQTTHAIQQIFKMHPLTLDGLDDAVRLLTRNA